MKFSSQIDALKISIKGFLPESSGTAPASPVEGQGWHDSGAAAWKVYLAAGWRTLVDARRAINTGAGLTGGGDLTADRSLAVDFAADGGGTSTQAVRGNDSRLANARTPSGTAGGDLTGSYPNPTVAPLAITDAKVAAANKDGAVGVPSLRTIGTGAQQALAGNTRLDTIAGATGPVSLSSQRITQLADPISGTDAANKQYVDQRVQGADWKDSVRAIATGNLPLSGLSPVDDVTLSSGDRVLAIGQTSAAANGIYVANSGAWTRSTDADGGTELSPNTAVFVEEGTQFQDTGWTLTTNGVVTIGTTAQSWAQFTGVSDLVAGGGLTKTGKQIDVVAGDGTILVNADSIVVGLVPITKGGTGATTAIQGRVNLGAATNGGTPIPALTAGAWTTVTIAGQTVDLGQLVGAQGQIRVTELATNEQVVLDNRVTGTKTVEVRSDVPWGANTLYLHVAGQSNANA